MCKIFSFLVYFSTGWHPKYVCKWKTNENTVPMHSNRIRMGIVDSLCVKLKFESTLTQKCPNTNFRYVCKCICAVRCDASVCKWVRVFYIMNATMCTHNSLEWSRSRRNTDNNVLFSKDVENCLLTFRVISISFRFNFVLFCFVKFAISYQHRTLFIWILLYVFFPFFVLLIKFI